MKKIILILVLGIITIPLFSQDSQEILKEGKLLCRLEKASWYGTDIFVEQFSHKKDSVGGYLSYVNKDNNVVNLFYKKDNPLNVLIRFEFETNPTNIPIYIDSLNHNATQQEIDLIMMRQDAIQRVSEDETGFFTHYENASFNFIPLIHNGKRNVFILTGPNVSNVLLLGNDYLFTYNKKNKLVKKEKLHNSLVPYTIESEDAENKIETTFHTHILTDYITSTDICTLLLYKDFTGWKQHYVMSKKYVSIFDIEKEVLIIMKKKAWDKITKSE